MVNAECKNLNLIAKLQEELNSSLEGLLGFNPCYTIKKIGKGYVYSALNNEDIKKSIYKVSFTFKLFFSENNNIGYIIIEWLGVRPKNTGMGTKIVNNFLDIVKKLGSIEKIYLHPQGFDAKRFWSRIGFKYNKSKNTPRFISYDMVLNIK